MARAGVVSAMLVLLAPLSAVAASGGGSCPTPSKAGVAVRDDYPIVPDYRAVLERSGCADLRCTNRDYLTEHAKMDAILFDRLRAPLSARAVRLILSSQRMPPALGAAEQRIERRQFRQAFRIYLDDFVSNVSSVRTLYLEDGGDTERVRALLEQLTGRRATPQDAELLAEIGDRHPHEFAPLLYLAAVLLEIGCTPQALRTYRIIPYVRPVVKATYSGVSSTAMLLALSIDPNAWRTAPANRPSAPATGRSRRRRS